MTMPPAKIRPLSQLEVQAHRIPAWSGTPNSTASEQPLLIYRRVFDESAGASQMEEHLRAVGVVEPQWRWPMYQTSHFHSNTHEVLCVSAGAARLCFGHEHNPDRVEVEVHVGDVMVVPAGVAHRMLLDHGAFNMVGAYPPGPRWDMCYGTYSEPSKVEAIKKLPWFDRDPVYGDEGPVLREQR